MLWGRLAGWFSILVPAVVWLVECFAARWARRTGRRRLIGDWPPGLHSGCCSVVCWWRLGAAGWEHSVGDKAKLRARVAQPARSY